MTTFFKAIEDLFVNYLFTPLDFLRNLQLDSWFEANMVNWLFLTIGLIAMIYWMKQLKKFNDRKEERKDVTGHSFL